MSDENHGPTLEDVEASVERIVAAALDEVTERYGAQVASTEAGTMTAVLWLRRAVAMLQHGYPRRDERARIEVLPGAHGDAP